MAEAAREYTPEDELELDALVKSVLGEQASGKYLGVRAKGVKGDEAFYGHAVVLTDPSLIDPERRKVDWDKLAKVATTIGNHIEIAGNVTFDLEPFYNPNNHNQFPQDV